MTSKRTTKPRPIADQLRTAIRQAEKRGITRYQIAQASDVSQAQLSRLMREGMIPRLDTAERIAAAIGFRLTLESAE